MKRYINIIILAILAVQSGGSVIRAQSEIPRLPGKFKSDAEALSVKEIRLDYRLIYVIIDSGTVYRRSANDDKERYFVGRGRVIVRDTARIDVQWNSLLGPRETIPFRSAYFCGNAVQRILGYRDSVWTQKKMDGRDHEQLRFRLEAPDRYFGVDLSGEFQTWARPDHAMLPLWIDLELDNGTQMVFYLTPEVAEQVNVFLYDKKFDYPYQLTSYPLSHFSIDDKSDGDSMIKVGTMGLTQPIKIDSTIIDVRLKESGQFDASCELVFAPGTDPRGIRLELPHLFKVDSVLDGRGEKPLFLKKLLRSNLYIGRRPEDSAASRRITIFYRGRFLVGPDLPVNMTSWFPRVPHRNLGVFTVRYTLHKDLTLLAVGEKIKDTLFGDLRSATYRTGDISYISFAAGVYDTLRDSAHGVPLTLFIRKENNQGLFNRSIPMRAMADLKKSFELFSDWFGAPIAKSLAIVDQPLNTGQSSPGLIHLSELSFEYKRDQARFRAHEVAHQWWGHTAVPATAHDLWLSEGLAEYSAALYLLDGIHDTAAFREQRDWWRRQVLQIGKIGGEYSRGYRAGPIALGRQLLDSYSPGDYRALVYYKAAYLLQMLRFEIDGPSYRTRFFEMMLADYLRASSGKKVTSVDFIGSAEKRLGKERAHAFFQNWLYGWQVPSFRCRWSTRPDNDGHPYLDVEIEAADVPAEFETPYPVEVEFADGSNELFRLDGIGRQKKHTLGPFPQNIRQVRFDPDHIILATKVEVIESQESK